MKAASFLLRNVRKKGKTGRYMALSYLLPLTITPFLLIGCVKKTSPRVVELDGVNWGVNFETWCGAGTRTSSIEANVISCRYFCVFLFRKWVFDPSSSVQELNDTLKINGYPFKIHLRRRGMYLETPVLLIVLKPSVVVETGEGEELNVPSCLKTEQYPSPPTKLKLDGHLRIEWNKTLKNKEGGLNLWIFKPKETILLVESTLDTQLRFSGEWGVYETNISSGESYVIVLPGEATLQWMREEFKI